MAGIASNGHVRLAAAVGGSLILTYALTVAITALRRPPSSQEHTAVNQVKESARTVTEEARHVSISKAAIKRFVTKLTDEDLKEMMAPTAYDSSIHFVDGTWRTVQYLLVLDALNFCFWPGAHHCPTTSLCVYSTA
jgi:hypothetical protein